MSLNFTNLVTQGRAHSNGRCWTAEEWEAVCLLVKECQIERSIAADFVRNGVTTVEGYKKAKAKDFVPQTLEEATEEVAKTMEAKGAEFVESTEEVKEPKSKKKIK